MVKCCFYIFGILFLGSCVSYSDLIVSKDYQGEKIRVQSHSEPCCGRSGLRYIYSESKDKETILYFYWFQSPFVEKQVRTLNGKRVIQIETYQLIFDKSIFENPAIKDMAMDSINLVRMKKNILTNDNFSATIPLNRIDSIFLFHSSYFLTNIDSKHEILKILEKGVGYIKGAGEHQKMDYVDKKIK